MGEKHFNRHEENDQFLELLTYDYPELFIFLELQSTLTTCMHLHARQGCALSFETSVEYVSTMCCFPPNAGGAWIFQMEETTGH